MEYKTQKNEVLRINPMDAKLVDIRSEVGYKQSVCRSQLIQEVVAVLQNDIKTQSYEEMTDRKPPRDTLKLPCLMKTLTRSSYTGKP